MSNFDVGDSLTIKVQKIKLKMNTVEKPLQTHSTDERIAVIFNLIY
jgi:hypothetical protein